MTKLGDAKFYLGSEIGYTNHGLWLHQKRCIISLQQRFGIEDCKPTFTPIYEPHFIATKKILQFLEGTFDYRLFFPNDKKMELTTFANADYGRCSDTKGPISKMVSKLGDDVINKSSKRQIRCSGVYFAEPIIPPLARVGKIVFSKTSITVLPPQKTGLWLRKLKRFRRDITWALNSRSIRSGINTNRRGHNRMNL
uniref:Uncharacterized protein n=1 Tax=Physcomitrium patens TaxID=3218 RepID=A0A2K1IA79_PHYPA|nr:hypothetical protein PHYPA_030751 [Physcomitrium patens]